MTKNEALDALNELLESARELPFGNPHISPKNLREIIDALSSPCVYEEPVAKGWLNYIERDDGTGLHLRLYLHNDPDDRPDDTEYVIVLPADEPQGGS